MEEEAGTLKQWWRDLPTERRSLRTGKNERSKLPRKKDTLSTTSPFQLQLAKHSFALENMIFKVLSTSKRPSSLLMDKLPMIRNYVNLERRSLRITSE
ncbi:hypothetical protein PIB30_071844 [Stylosanthes scabra]|uniref:Uncharacterized protein n=1 Tax=Stylosanthes scabra TaxID=79078 RepID=A0ABU6SPB5_9FABA|nr:hypothetical protein [Stylosanthes scabra]